MTEQAPGSSAESRIPDPNTRERVANAIFEVAADMHREEAESRLGELPAGTNLSDVSGPYQKGLRWAHSRAVLADTTGGRSYQEMREAEPFVPRAPDEAAPFPGGPQPVETPVERPRQ